MSGIEISHTSATIHNRVVGNFVGTDLTGTSGPKYSFNYDGIVVKDRVANNLVANNVIGNNRHAGIIYNSFNNCCTIGNLFQYNLIGISLNGTPIANRNSGILIESRSGVFGPGNVIAYNPVGISITGDTNDNNTISQNMIFGNTVLGIDIAPLGVVNPNDPGDTDSGPNQQLNFPVLQNATPQKVTGTACAGCIVEIFVADKGEGAYGQGKIFAGSAKADGSGNFGVNVMGVQVGQYVTSTATDSRGNTSEFSLNMLVSGVNNTPTPKPTWSPTPTPTSTPLPGPGPTQTPNPGSPSIWLPLVIKN
jgi:hypothetical protein